jgi:hypothetical protein
MTGYGVRVGVGTRFTHDGEIVEIVELLTTSAGTEVLLRYPKDQRILRVGLRELLGSSHARVIPDDACPTADDDSELAGVLLAQMPDAERAQVADRAEHIRELLTGFRSGHAEMRRQDEPRPEFDPRQPLEARYAAKAAELSVAW